MSKTAIDLIRERVDRARAKLDEAIQIAKDDRQLAILELLVLARKDLA